MEESKKIRRCQFNSISSQCRVTVAFSPLPFALCLVIVLPVFSNHGKLLSCFICCTYEIELCRMPKCTMLSQSRRLF